MPIYIVVPLIPISTIIDSAIEQSISSAADRYKLQAGRGWLINFNGTTIELSNHIGLTGQEKESPSFIGSAIIVPVSGYYGRGPTDMWEWLKVRMEQ